MNPKLEVLLASMALVLLVGLAVYLVRVADAGGGLSRTGTIEVEGGATGCSAGDTSSAALLPLLILPLGALRLRRRRRQGAASMRTARLRWVVLLAGAGSR